MGADVTSDPGLDFGGGTTTTFDPGTWSDPGMSWPSYDPAGGSVDPWNTPSVGQDPNVYSNPGAGGVLGSLEQLLQSPTAKGLISGGGGIYQLLQGRNLQGMAQTAFGRSDPFGQYRGVYGQQLMNLMAHPDQITNDPGYKFAFGQGQQAVERSAAARGFLGSGNEAIALQEYGMGFANDYLHQQEQFLSGLAGSGISPNFGAALGGYGAGADLSGQGLAGLAYGTTRFGGAAAGTPGSARPSSAGGEAATAVGTANQAMNLYNTAAGVMGGTKIPTGKGTVGGMVGAANDVLGVYGGIQRGGVLGYTRAGTSAIDLATKAGMDTGAAGAVVPYANAALSLYNFAENWQSGDTGGDTLRGAEAGAAIGSVVPVIGTVLGGVIGGVVGAASSAFGPGEKDPEMDIWAGYANAYNKNPQSVQSAPPNARFLSLAGLFDLRPHQITGQIPFYNKYGRMGEGQFTQDMTKQISQALTAGTISPTDSASTIYSKVVNPWINSMGAWNDPNKEAQQALLTGMVQDYISGQHTGWKSIGGDYSLNITPYKGSGVPTPTTNVSPLARFGNLANPMNPNWRTGGPPSGLLRAVGG